MRFLKFQNDFLLFLHAFKFIRNGEMYLIQRLINKNLLNNTKKIEFNWQIKISIIILKVRKIIIIYNYNKGNIVIKIPKL